MLSVCKTISGPDLDKQCKFPFIYQGREFHNCITIDNRNQPWCSTEVNAENYFIIGKWGICSDSCKGLCFLLYVLFNGGFPKGRKWVLH